MKEHEGDLKKLAKCNFKFLKKGEEEIYLFFGLYTRFNSVCNFSSLFL